MAFSITGVARFARTHAAPTDPVNYTSTRRQLCGLEGWFSCEEIDSCFARLSDLEPKRARDVLADLVELEATLLGVARDRELERGAAVPFALATMGPLAELYKADADGCLVPLYPRRELPEVGADAVSPGDPASVWVLDFSRAEYGDLWQCYLERAVLSAVVPGAAAANERGR